MSDTMKFRCAKCGGNQFALPANPQPDDPVTCAGCGAVARYEDVQTSAVAQAKGSIEQSMQDILGKAGFTFK